jgi:hypothetical protein
MSGHVLCAYLCIMHGDRLLSTCAGNLIPCEMFSVAPFVLLFVSGVVLGVQKAMPLPDKCWG